MAIPLSSAPSDDRGHAPALATGTQPPSTEQYAAILREYLRTRSEDALYAASQLSRACIDGDLGPEEIIALHAEAYTQSIEGMAYREQARAGTDAMAFLLEVMIAYGVQHRELLDQHVAARERAEAALARESTDAEDASESQRTAEEHLAMIVHELRTPLTAALSSVDLALRGLQRGDVTGPPRLLGTAREALLRLSRLSGALLDASRRGPTALARVPVELVVVLSQACAWAAAIAEEKGIELVRERGPFSLRVLGDEDALLTIFGNLLANAIRYTSRGTVTVRYGTRGPDAFVEVADTGMGILAEELPKIFDAFYRGAQGRAVEQEGLGLGLTLAQRFAAAQGGRIEVESTVGAGSTFRVLLPLMTSGEEYSQDG